MRLWHILHRIPWPLRWPLKLAAFVVVFVLVLFPRVWLLPTYFERLRNLDALIDQHHPGLAPLEAQVRAALPPSADGSTVLPIVERVVYQHIPYAWDWVTWGVFDYVPTVDEALAHGREDCDGRAVIAASLLRRLGYEANLVSDLKHVWVVTPKGATMSPGDGPPTLASAGEGTRLAVGFDTLANLARGSSYGLAVFPLTRLLILWLVLVTLTAHPWSSRARRTAGTLLLLLAIALLRDSGAVATGLAEFPRVALAGWAAAAVGWLLLAVKGAAPPPRSSALESPAADAPARR
jgi:hypothetical protein